jgi:hypothetical protein
VQSTEGSHFAAPEFPAGIILPANLFWQDCVQELLSDKSLIGVWSSAFSFLW